MRNGLGLSRLGFDEFAKLGATLCFASTVNAVRAMGRPQLPNAQKSAAPLALSACLGFGRVRAGSGHQGRQKTRALDYYFEL